MHLFVALLLQTAATPERIAVSAVRERPRLSYRLDQASGRGGRVDWEGLDRSLAGAARRESRGTAAAHRVQRWRGVPVVIVDGKVHGLW